MITKTFIHALFFLLQLIVVYSKKQAGDACTCRFGTEDGFDGVYHYFESPTSNGKCTDGGDLVCLTENDDGIFNEDFPGTCKTAKCVKPQEDDDGKITICHRTCSENNPWVRITIDSSAWADHSCGHTTETCTGIDRSYWGDFQGDYIIKEHGTRDEVAASLNNDVEAIKAYWKEWEPGCPSVRNGQCCHFDGQYGCKYRITSWFIYCCVDYNHSFISFLT
jgi:hypothetical protein